MHCPTQCPWPCTRPLLTHDSAGDSWTLTGKSGSVSCGVSAHKVLFVPCKSLFSQSCKFWWLYSGVNGDLLQEGLCHTQVCCTQGPCGWPLLTCTSIGDVHTLKGRSCSVSVESPGAHKVLFVSSEHLWRVWGLILNMIFPLLPSCFSFALGCGIYFFLVGSNILLLMVVQQWVVILEFLQEKMSTCPSTPPSCF